MSSPLTTTGPDRQGYNLMAQMLADEPPAVRRATATALRAERAALDIADPRSLAIGGALLWITEHTEGNAS